MFEVTGDELRSGFVLRYNTANDCYVRGSEKKSGWDAMVHKYKNIQRKVENDWKMCYLARTEGSDDAFIEWRFDITGRDKQIFNYFLNNFSFF